LLVMTSFCHFQKETWKYHLGRGKNCCFLEATA
jgi:hypothetical protein